MSNEIKEINNRICQNCKYHYIEEISFDYPQSCCNKTNPNHTTEKWLNCDNFEYSEDYITNLQQENERLKNELVKIPRAKLEYDLELEDYKSRVEKAVELIKKAIIQTDITGNGTLNLNDLLELLQGGKDDSDLPTN